MEGKLWGERERRYALRPLMENFASLFYLGERDIAIPSGAEEEEITGALRKGFAPLIFEADAEGFQVTEGRIGLTVPEDIDLSSLASAMRKWKMEWKDLSGASLREGRLRKEGRDILLHLRLIGSRKALPKLREGESIHLLYSPGRGEEESFSFGVPYYKGSREERAVIRKLSAASSRSIALGERGLGGALLQLSEESSLQVFADLGQVYYAPEILLQASRSGRDPLHMRSAYSALFIGLPAEEGENLRREGALTNIGTLRKGKGVMLLRRDGEGSFTYPEEQ